MIQHLSQLREQAADNLTKTEKLFNPSKNDFKLSILGNEIVIPSREIKEMTKNQAMILKKRLIDQLINERNINYPTPEVISELQKEIEVKL